MRKCAGIFRNFGGERQECCCRAFVCPEFALCLRSRALSAGGRFLRGYALERRTLCCFGRHVVFPAAGACASAARGNADAARRTAKADGYVALSRRERGFRLDSPRLFADSGSDCFPPCKSGRSGLQAWRKGRFRGLWPRFRAKEGRACASGACIAFGSVESAVRAAADTTVTGAFR